MAARNKTCPACTFAGNAEDALECDVCLTPFLASAVVPEAGDAEHWTCARCTYSNAARYVECEMCLSPRSPSTFSMDSVDVAASSDLFRRAPERPSPAFSSNSYTTVPLSFPSKSNAPIRKTPTSTPSRPEPTKTIKIPCTGNRKRLLVLDDWVNQEDGVVVEEPGVVAPFRSRLLGSVADEGVNEGLSHALKENLVAFLAVSLLLQRVGRYRSDQHAYLPERVMTVDAKLGLCFRIDDPSFVDEVTPGPHRFTAGRAFVAMCRKVLGVADSNKLPVNLFLRWLLCKPPFLPPRHIWMPTNYLPLAHIHPRPHSQRRPGLR